MRKLIAIDLAKCVGCNRCIRVCPVEEANVAYIDNGDNKVHLVHDKCIACGACLLVCRHGSRWYEDDTERFFQDLRKGTPISLICAPAARANLQEWDKVLALLHQMGARKLYDVSLGADICIWGHIRYIQKSNSPSIITQPCPAIVDYILLHRNELISYLSPVQSPMLCAAIYMKKYQGISDKIAAISPCIAKANELDQTGKMVSYNVTFAKLEEYIKDHNLRLPAQGRGYDHFDCSLGSIFSMPGGLKENVEFILGNKNLSIDKSEGQRVVYGALNAFCKEDKANLPAIFDVLNCSEGCNLGTGCHHKRTVFEVNRSMDKARQNALQGRDREYFEKQHQEYDKALRLDDFMRRYYPLTARGIKVTERDIEDAFEQLGKRDDVARTYDCCACGSDSCRDMAVRIAKKINTAENCILKSHNDIRGEHASVVFWQKRSIESISAVEIDIANIKEMADRIIVNVADVDKAVKLYDVLTKDINKIASNIHMISLNASIESARAGEHGRSFSIVAEAIRALAEETQGATSKISKASTEAKNALAGISDMLKTIGEAIAKSHVHVQEIASSSRGGLDK